MKRPYLVSDSLLFITTQCVLCRVKGLVAGKKKIVAYGTNVVIAHFLFSANWCLISPSVLCTMCLYQPPAETSHQLQ